MKQTPNENNQNIEKLRKLEGQRLESEELLKFRGDFNKQFYERKYELNPTGEHLEKIEIFSKKYGPFEVSKMHFDINRELILYKYKDRDNEITDFFSLREDGVKEFYHGFGFNCTISRHPFSILYVFHFEHSFDLKEVKFKRNPDNTMFNQDGLEFKIDLPRNPIFILWHSPRKDVKGLFERLTIGDNKK